MPGTVLLLAASPVGKSRLVDAASVLPVLAAVPPAVLSGTETANVVELADPLEPQAVLTRLRAVAATPGPLTVFVTGQLALDRRQHLPHLALARTTPATVRYTALPWQWIREEFRLRSPGSTTLVLDLHADADSWGWLRTHALDCGRNNAVFGRIAPPPSRRTVAAPAYMKTIATILRSGWRPPVEQLHQQAFTRLGPDAYGDVVLTVPPLPTPAGPAPGYQTPHPAATAPAQPVTAPAGVAPEPSSWPEQPGSQAPHPAATTPAQPVTAPAGVVPGPPSRPEQPGSQAPAVAAPAQPVAAPGLPPRPEQLRPQAPDRAPQPAGAVPSSSGDLQRSGVYGAVPPMPVAPPVGVVPGPPRPQAEVAAASPAQDPHVQVTVAVQAGRHQEADTLAAAHEQTAARAHGPASEQALHWSEVRADLAMFARDSARSCRIWLTVAETRLAAGQAPDSPGVEKAVDRAHHQWGQVRDKSRAQELGALLAQLRARVPGRRPGALENVRKQLRELQATPF
ncbi:hypothetical protein M2163_005254 [Streptomyces sp. SAI-135]|uniref:hypothetical protein n=1 Tax=unclassified Streptomyces TaxID=2593676 RepID=UPI0024742AA5|nr:MULTISPECIES: hypothetical protein [unclassified Streptomyces]MDH6517764.1 hypothetical protein [Streptomyces sp. SAI-090]MDH6618146.1 hypothetical protein [Streptomyces sp. SAI-135]